MGIILALLFILQMISFMIITLLFMKVSKFNNLEKKQQKLMADMDESVMAYLTEIKEENDRLIKQLNESSIKRTESVKEKEQPEIMVTPEKVQQKPQPVPIHFALRSYQKTASSTAEAEPLTDRQKIKNLYADGRTVQEIAKELGKGQTEIELILKFD